MLDRALKLAALGFHVFPLIPNSKEPQIKNYPVLATQDIPTITAWWNQWPDANIGISTSRFGDGQYLCVLDIDNKGDVCGEASLEVLQRQGGYALPDSYHQFTPTGGRHVVFTAPYAVTNSAGKLGPGLDVRGRGGYIVGAGSSIDGATYRHGSTLAPAEAPTWLLELAGKARGRPAGSKSKKTIEKEVNEERARQKAIDAIQSFPVAQDGTRNEECYRVACRVRDEGLDEHTTAALLIEHFAAEPPLGSDEIEKTVKAAYTYAAGDIGNRAPEVQFPDITEEDLEDAQVPQGSNDGEEGEESAPSGPFEKLNEEYAYVLVGGGGHILRETTDHQGRARLDHLSVQTFHQYLAAQKVKGFDDKLKALSQLWMASSKRRTYDGLVFAPGQDVPARFYNLWRGFAIEPLEKGEKPTKIQKRALKDYLDHIRENVCRGDEVLHHWLMSYFAALFQRPNKKPLTALVFRGGKGVGKSFVVEQLSKALGHHAFITADRRYLVGNFNGHLENCLLIVLDEAFWSGDKQVEGLLKTLITGTEHQIERKGSEPYTVANLTRVVIISNEKWAVPASQDERRFAVFEVSSARQQDTEFFSSLARDMEEGGGLAYLLRYLLDYDIGDVNLDQAPSTEGLREQKINSLEPIPTYWYECLVEGAILEAEFEDGKGWPADGLIAKKKLREAYARWRGGRGIGGRIESAHGFGRALGDMFTELDGGAKIKGAKGSFVSAYRLPTLPDSRAQFEKWLRHEVEWDKEA